LQEFTLGKTSIQALHTPGHTLESTCFLLKDENNNPHALFTGDTLFVGDVGRPDLSSGNLSSVDLAGIMYDTLQKQILPLPDAVLVYPAHGPGSSCGKNLGPNTHSTIGEEKATNPNLKPMDKETFVKQVTEGLDAAPVYFAINANINQKGYNSFDNVKANALQPLTVEDIKQQKDDADLILLDTRPATTFTLGFVPGSISIGLEGRFAEWAANILPFNKKIIIIAEEGKQEETATRLARVGLDNMIGYLQGGFEAWQQAGEPIDMVIDVEADELIMDIPHDANLTVLDVRKFSEYADGHIKDAQNLPVQSMTDVTMLAQFEDNENIYVHCQGGYRSVIAVSLLKKEGIHNVRNVVGGYNSIKQVEGAKIVKEKAEATS
jgi:hydroxyacylglutathione hydrolase